MPTPPRSFLGGPGSSGLPPMVDPMEALAALTRNPSFTNANNLAPIFKAFYQDANTADPAGRQDALRQADEVGTALGAGPAYEAQMRAQDAQRRGAINDQLGAEADLGSGRPQHLAMLRAALENQVGDVNSEASARRQFGPFAQQAHQQEMGDLLAKGQVQYGYPAQIKAQSDQAVAQTDANTKMQEAQLRYSLPTILGQRFAGGHDLVDKGSAINQAFHGSDTTSQSIDVLKHLMQSNGGQLSPEMVDILRKLLQPGQQMNLPTPVPRGYSPF